MAGPGPTIRLRTLGSLQLHDAAGEEAQALLAQPRRVVLLVYLVLATPRGYHRRDKLLALFWPDHDETRARNALSQAVHFLRRALGADAVLSHADHEIGVNPDLLWCDGLEIEAAYSAGRWDEVLELYRGVFLDGVHISSAAPELEQWIDAERTHLGRRYAQALERMADAREAAGDHDGAVIWLRKLAAHDPVNSRAALRLMAALDAAGDRPGAIRHARVHEALVREQLGASVHPDIAALTRTLQSAAHSRPGRPEPTPAPPASAQASVDSTISANGPTTSVANTEAAKPANSFRPLGGGALHRGPWRGVQRVAIALAGLAIVSLALLFASGRNRADTPSPLPISCLAVLPLENLSHDSTQEFFADGVTDAVITELARHERLNVISRTSSMRYKRSTKPLPAIGRELNCDGLIEGTISTDGNRVHVNAQLLYAPDDHHLWAMGYDGEMSDMLALERQIADSIATQIHGVTTPARASPARRVDPVAYGQYLRGRDAFRSRNPASLRQAIDLYKQAIARDSTFALGYAGLADAYRFLGGLGYAPRAPLTDSARLMATRALILDSTLSEAHTALAALLTDEADWTNAEVEFKRAIDLEPGNSLAHQWYATMLATVARKDDALQEIRRASELDPLSQALQGAKVDIERYAGVRDSRVVLKERANMIDPTHPGTVATLSVNLARQGRCAEAYAENQKAQQLAPDNTTIRLSLVGVHMLCDRRADARALLDSIERRPDVARTGVFLAEVFAAKQPDSAFAWLDRTEWGMSSRFQLRVSPRLSPLRSDPRYTHLLERMGLRR